MESLDNYDHNDGALGGLRDQIEIDVECLRIWERPARYGAKVSVILTHIFKDTEGHRIVWFGRKEQNNFKIGEKVRIQGKILHHRMQFGKIATVVNWVKRVESKNNSPV